MSNTATVQKIISFMDEEVSDLSKQDYLEVLQELAKEAIKKATE